ncbi:MAG: sugar phosphate isomerase/epimerase [Oscillospiraceae bacterium]|nr:sugar phosphate isomerase/epimerase [Oscillospiraceae bacterium]
MKPGIMLYVNCKKADLYEQIRTLVEIGVEHTFVNVGCCDIDNVLRYMKEVGLTCDNLHSEYAGNFRGEDCTMQDICFEGDAGDRMLEILMENVDKCKEHGVPVLVVHSPVTEPEVAKNETTARRYTALGDYAREKGITLAFENISYTENVEYALSLVPDAKFCWDCGHENCRRKDEKPMPLFGKKVAALHIHDNFLDYDHHLIPFDGKIDFDEVAHALADSGFDGTLMLEIPYGANEYLSRDESYKAFALRAKTAAEKVIELVKNYRR